jgi:hypothetical protein
MSFWKPSLKQAWSSLNAKFWNFYERFYEWLFRLKPVGPPGEGILRLGLTHYRGPGIELEGGIRLKKGEIVGELHTNNDLIINLRRSIKDPLAFYAEILRRMRISLRELAKLADSDPKLLKVRAFRGTTLLYQAAKRVGFEVFPVETKTKEVWETRVQYFFLRKYLEESFEKKKDKELVSHRIWLSRPRLMRLYGNHSSGK